MKKRVAILTGVLMSAGPASAFYFPDWPGAAVRSPPSLVPPEVPTEGNPPSLTPPSWWEFPPPTETTTPPNPTEPTPPGTVPEPGTLVIGGIGLLAVAAVRRMRK